MSCIPPDVNEPCPARIRPRATVSVAAVAAAALVFAPGCETKPVTASARVSARPNARVVKPTLRTISRKVGQPGYIDAYEQTSLYAKVAGYVLSWSVDIGDRVKKDAPMAELSVPELVEDHSRKQAQVGLDRALVEQSRKMVDVAQGNVQSAQAEQKEANAELLRYQAGVDRWESEVKRLTDLAKQKVIDQQILDESQRQLKANIAARDAARATIQTKEAHVMTRDADLAKANVDVTVAQSQVKVSEADERRLAALVAYTHITAPYDGVVTVRNANTGDFVQPASGDQSANPRSPDESAARGTPIYVVARTDVVRVYVDVPEMDANYVTKGTPARVLVQALSDDEMRAEVTRTSWALRTRSRTLRAEIDMPNPNSKLLPGMYAYGSVLIERAGVRTVPTEAVTQVGNQVCCYLLKDGRAVQTPVQTGIGDGTYIELSKKEVDGKWAPFTGDEDVLVGDLTEITSGQAVKVEAAAGKK